MICKVVPYEGNEPYIFFSYCHMDSEIIYPIIEKLAKKGFHIWYDDGIHPGDNWVEAIAMHLNKAAICIAAITRNSVDSHNCRNEINFAIENKKALLPIILEDFSMPLGVRLQLSSSHFIKKYELKDENLFFEKLFEAKQIDSCKGSDIEFRETEECVKEVQVDEAPQLDCVEESVNDDLIIEVVLEEKKVEEESLLDDYSNMTEETSDESDYEPTIREERTIRVPKSKKTSKVNEVICKAILIRILTNELFELDKSTVKIGRNKNRCDIYIDNPTISSLHATFLNNSHGIFIRDEDSSNGTRVDTKEIEGLKLVPLDKCAFIELFEEQFLFASGKFADAIMKYNTYAFLKCKETEEIKILTEDILRLGRTHQWTGGTFSDTRVSRNHGKISFEEGKYVLIARDEETTNGTFINDKALMPKDRVILKSKDEIRFGSAYHIIFEQKKVINGGK